jgi:hypothetical protein
MHLHQWAYILPSPGYYGFKCTKCGTIKNFKSFDPNKPYVPPSPESKPIVKAAPETEYSGLRFMPDKCPQKQLESFPETALYESVEELKELVSAFSEELEKRAIKTQIHKPRSVILWCFFTKCIKSLIKKGRILYDEQNTVGRDK